MGGEGRRQELARGQRVTTSPHTIVTNDFKLICIAPIRLALISLALRLTVGKRTDTLTTLLGINQSAPGELEDVSGMMRAVDFRKHSALSTRAHPMAVSFASIRKGSALESLLGLVGMYICAPQDQDRSATDAPG
jgi:hypothetical protein